MSGGPGLPERPSALRVVLMCHDDDELALEGLTRWLASWSSLVGIVVVQEPKSALRRRVRRELRRVGVLRLFDVLSYRLYHRFVHAGHDEAWRRKTLAELKATYPAIPPAPKVTASRGDTEEVQQFLREHAPDFVLARYKSILPERIFSIPAHGTWVLHPGICPEYRNAHGAFWALVERDLSRVGATLLRIDAGIDTGPVFGYFSPAFDEVTESHVVIQERSVFANLDAIAATLQSVITGGAGPLPTSGRSSRNWGQPWLTAYFRWKRAARQAAR